MLMQLCFIQKIYKKWKMINDVNICIYVNSDENAGWSAFSRTNRLVLNMIDHGEDFAMKLRNHQNSVDETEWA